jgi:hypothetical protein
VVYLDGFGTAGGKQELRLGRESDARTQPSERRHTFFAQRFAEMLSSATFESYRVYTLCTVSRLYEALAVIDASIRYGFAQWSIRSRLLLATFTVALASWIPSLQHATF